MTATTIPTTVQFGRRCRRGNRPAFLLMTGGSHRRRRGRGRGMRGAGGFDSPFLGGRRAGRGNIRAAILALLNEQPMHGYQIIQELSERSGGVWRPSPGSVYPTLQQLEDEELVEPAESESGRRVFRLTEAGREETAQQTGQAPWEKVGDQADDTLVELRDLVHQVLAATRQVAQAGTSQQVSAAQDVLRATRKSLYRLLAEDDVPESGETR